MKTWFNTLSPRERTLVMVAGIASVILLFWLLLADPLLNKNKRLHKIINNRENQLDVMQKQRVLIKQLQQQAKKPVNHNGRNPQQLIERALRTWRLKPSLERMQSQGPNGVRIILKNVNADRLMRFLHELEDKYALSISDMTLNNAKKESGFADVRLTIKKSSK